MTKLMDDLGKFFPDAEKSDPDYADIERVLGRPMTAAERRGPDLVRTWLRAPAGPEKDAAAAALDEHDPTTRARIQGTIARIAAVYSRAYERMLSEVRRTKRQPCGFWHNS